MQKSPASSSHIPPGVTVSTAPTHATPGQGNKSVSSQATSTARPQGVNPKFASKKPPNITSTPVSRRATALVELNHLSTDGESSPESTPTARTVSSGAVEKSFPGATDRAVAQDQVDQAKLRVIALQAAAEEEIRFASVTKQSTSRLMGGCWNRQLHTKR